MIIYSAYYYAGFPINMTIGSATEGYPQIVDKPFPRIPAKPSILNEGGATRYTQFFRFLYTSLFVTIRHQNPNLFDAAGYLYCLYSKKSMYRQQQYIVIHCLVFQFYSGNPLEV